MIRKVAGEITIADLERFPVWEYTNDDEMVSELMVCSVDKIPVTTLSNRLVGTKVKFENGDDVWAALGNINLENVRLTEQFLLFSVFKGNQRFTIARYHDVD